MFNLNLGDFPNKVKQDVAFILYYTFNSYIPVMVLFIIVSQTAPQKFQMSDTVFFLAVLMISAIIGYTIWLIKPSPESLAIKRRHFIAGFVNVLSENGKTQFREVVKFHSYSVFGNKGTILMYKEYAKILIILINLGAIELVNQKEFQNKCHEFDFDLFENNIDEMIFCIKTKNLDIDNLVSRVQNYLF